MKTILSQEHEEGDLKDFEPGMGKHTTIVVNFQPLEELAAGDEFYIRYGTKTLTAKIVEIDDG